MMGKLPIEPHHSAPDVEIDFDGDFCVPGLVDLHTTT